MVARVLRKTDLACPNCGSSNVVRQKREPLGYQKNAKCLSCGFEIFKSNLQISLEMLITVCFYAALGALHVYGASLSKVQVLSVVAALIASLFLFRLTERIPDSAAAEESAIHRFGSRVLWAGQILGVVLVALYLLRM